MPKHKSKGPISLQGAAPAPAKKAAQQSDGPAPMSLRVLAGRAEEDAQGLPAAVDFGSTDQLQELEAAGHCFLQLAAGSDCILYVRSDVSVPAGCILLDEVQRHNLHAAPGELYKFSVFGPPADDAHASEGPFALVEVEAEVRRMEGASSTSSMAAVTEPLEVDASELSAMLGRRWFGRVLAVNEYLAVQLHGASLLLRITATHNLSEEEQEEAIGSHCYRGLLTPDTCIYLHALGANGVSAERTAVGSRDGSSRRVDAGGQSSESSSCSSSSGSDSDGDDASDAAKQQRAQQQHQQQQHHAAASASTARGHGPGAAHVCSTSGNGVSNGSSGNGSSGDGSSGDGNGSSGNASGSNGASGGGPLHCSSHSMCGTEPRVLPQSRVARLAGSVKLIHAPERAQRRAPTNVVLVHTNDGDGGEGECFPVKKRLLRPCIALTKVVRDSGDAVPGVTVDVDTLTFDRVLIYLEALALGKPLPNYALHLLDDLQQAARTLGLRSLEDLCSERLGSRAAALATFTVADVARANAAGKAQLMLDGMVLDVTRWLPEHPGGSTIIPEQALNVDCCRFFELYHASRESFLYLKEFYIGELLPFEKASVVAGGGEQGSADFMQQLREYTSWRIPAEQLPAKASW